MAELCRFYGIVIAVFFNDAGKHHRPHIHAFSAEFAASFAIDDGTLLAGAMPTSLKRVIAAFITARRPQLQAAWEAAQAGKAPAKVAPMRLK